MLGLRKITIIFSLLSAGPAFAQDETPYSRISTLAGQVDSTCPTQPKTDAHDILWSTDRGVDQYLAYEGLLFLGDMYMAFRCNELAADLYRTAANSPERSVAQGARLGLERAAVRGGP